MSTDITTDIGTELLFENDRIRVWDMRLEPGEESPLHRHEGDYVFIYTTPSRLTAFVEDKAPQTFEFDDGFVQYTEVGQGTTHKIRNDSDQVHRQILVEFKGASRSAEIQQPETNKRVKGLSYERLFPRS